jgi:hypothetical protein
MTAVLPAAEAIFRKAIFTSTSLAANASKKKELSSRREICSSFSTTTPQPVQLFSVSSLVPLIHCFFLHALAVLANRPHNRHRS